MTITSGSHRTEVAIIHYDGEALMRLSVAATRNGFVVSATHSPRPLETAAATLRTSPAAMILAVHDDDDPTAIAGDARSRGVPMLLFLAPSASLCPAIWRLNVQRECAVLTEDAPRAVVIATLITLLAREKVAL